MTRQPPFADARPAIQSAVEWAARMHADQRRDDDAPFIVHPLEAAALLSSSGYDDEVVIAGVLHDIVESTGATLEDVRGRFGDRVAHIVGAVTEDPGIADHDTRKARLRAAMGEGGPDAHAVYTADKISKVRELRAQVTRNPALRDDPGVQRRLEHYECSLETLRAVAPELRLVDKLAFELWALRTLPPHP
jgi:(p)ppGpp synthase/HD superfamily hydrolase